MDEETRRLVDATMLGEAVESLPLAIFVSDASLNYLAVNAAAAELVGLSRGELLERRVSDVVAAPYQTLQRAAAEAETTGLDVGEAAIRRADGELVDVVYTTMTAKLGRLPVLVTFVRPKTSGELDLIVDALMAGVHAGTLDPPG